MNQRSIKRHKLELKRVSVACLSGNLLKLSAVLFMFIDHTTKILLYPTISALFQSEKITYDSYAKWMNFMASDLRYIGAMAFPIFCFMLVEGFYYTKNKLNYLKIMLCFALCSELFFDTAFFSEKFQFQFYWEYQNVMFTFFIGLIMLFLLEQLQIYFTRETGKLKLYLSSAAVVFMACFLAIFFHTDYSATGILYILAFYLGKRNIFNAILYFTITYFFFHYTQPTFYFFVMLGLLFMYNGKRGTWNLKYFFYLFYPLHLLLLFFLKSLL